MADSSPVKYVTGQNTSPTDNMHFTDFCTLIAMLAKNSLLSHNGKSQSATAYTHWNQSGRPITLLPYFCGRVKNLIIVYKTLAVLH